MTRFLSLSFKGAAAALALTVATTTARAEVLTMSSWVPPTHFLHTDVLVPFTERVAEVTEGRVTVTILPAPLASPPQHWELARTGVADITWGNFTYEPERFVPLWFAEFPKAGTDAEAQSRALWRTYETYLADLPAFDGVEVLGVGLFGGGQLHHGARAMVGLGDLAGQKVRMGGPIQERLLSSLGAVPVAAPATKAYELLESGVVDASLHTMESVVNFRLEDSLTHHTVFPDGLYDAAFFVAMNEGRWTRLSDADRAAIESITGEALSAAWGESFDIQHPAAVARLEEKGHKIVAPSEALLAEVDAVYDEMVADWIEKAEEAGLEDPAAALAYYRDTYQSLAAE